MKKWIIALCCVCVALAIPYFTIEQKVNLPCGTHNDYNKKAFWQPWGDHMHNGIDIFARKGTEIKSATYGVVVNIQRGTNIGGNTVSVLGTRGRIYYYAHLDSIYSSVGQFVTPSTVLGTVGNTGNAVNTPAHVHFSIFSPWKQGHECHKDSKYWFYCMNPILEFN